MKLADVSIRRPVFTAMISCAVVVFGAFLYLRLPVDMLPDADFPVVTVLTVYPGASPETVESQIAEPIEEALGTLGGVDNMRTICMENAVLTIIEFDFEVDLDASAQDVRDRVAAVRSRLPDGVQEPRVEKLDLNASPIFQLAVSGSGDPAELTRYAEDVLQPALQAINGVGQVELVGARGREVHVWLDPGALRSRGLTVLEIAQALGAQNVEIPGGNIDRGDEELSLRTDARASTPEELERLVLVTIPGGGGFVRLGDVARVVDGVEEETSVAELDGRPALAVVVRKQSGQNTVEVASRVRTALASLAATAPPGIDVQIILDNSTFISSAIGAVQTDLLIGAVLAVLIIFVFLRDLRSTFISALALPTSVIGTFAFMKVMGFTINILTAMALSLSIGILIDDAIVVLENISRRRTKLGEGPQDAAYRGTSEIGLAVLATTLSIVAVFVPVAFATGLVGRFLLQFGLTVAFAVMLSLFVSLTLTPMLSSRLLAAHGEQRERGLAAIVGGALSSLDRSYRGAVVWVLRHRIVTLAAATATLAGVVAIAPRLGFELLPAEERGQFKVGFELPPGASLDETAGEARRIAEQLRQIPGVATTFATTGGGALAQSNRGEILVSLVPPARRTYSDEEAQAYVRRVLAAASVPRYTVEKLGVFGLSMGRTSTVQMLLMGDDLDQLGADAERLAERLRRTPGFVDVDTTWRPGRPELRVDIDRGRAADLGVLGAPLGITVRMLVAGQVVTQLEEEGEQVDVRLQLPPNARQSARAVELAQVRSPAGALVDVGSVANVSLSTSPNQIERYNRRRQVALYANLEGLSLGQAIEQAGAAARDVVSPETDTTFVGLGGLLSEAMMSLILALALGVICVYMVLASQFESLLHPFTIMVSLPFSLIGGFAALLVAGATINVITMIGFIMLMGIVTKNAILVVDFANRLQREGRSVTEALVEAGATRLRPILMTTAAMIFGMLPTAIGHGVGSELRAPMGIAVIGGLVTSTLLTLLVVPVVYTLMDSLGRLLGRLWSSVARRWRKTRPAPLAGEPAA